MEAPGGHIGGHLAVRSWRCLLVALVVCLSVRHSSSKSISEHMFWSDVHLEHFYILEENVLSHADILLRDNYFDADEHESAEEHESHAVDLTELQETINETKEIHRDAGPDLHSYLSNPINVYHMMHRLNSHWRRCLDLLLTTKPCKEWNVRTMKQRLMYLRNKLPGPKEVEAVIQFTTMLQRIHDIKAAEVSQGKLGESESTKPLHIHEQMEFSTVLRDSEDFYASTSWLKNINDQLKVKGHGSDVNRSSVLIKMASNYFNLKDFASATKASEEAYKLNPSSGSAKRSLDYFKSKLASDSSKPRVMKKYKSRFEKSCAKSVLSKGYQRCFYSRVGLNFIKTEIIRNKPLVYIFHDVVQEEHADKLKDYAFKTQSDKAWVGDEKYVVPDFRTSLHPKRLQHASKYVKIAAQKWIEALAMLAKEVQGINELRWGSPSVVNLGLDGMHLSHHDKDLGVVRPLFGETSVFYTYLSEAHVGGDAVFSRWGITAQPSKGSVIYYSTSRQSAHSHCPSIGSSIWMIVQPIYESPKNYCNKDDEWK